MRIEPLLAPAMSLTLRALDLFFFLSLIAVFTFITPLWESFALSEIYTAPLAKYAFDHHVCNVAHIIFSFRRTGHMRDTVHLLLFLTALA
jgi:hypothetical protein